jgi:hypothetical protein
MKDESSKLSWATIIRGHKTLSAIVEKQAATQETKWPELVQAQEKEAHEQ